MVDDCGMFPPSVAHLYPKDIKKFDIEADRKKWEEQYMCELNAEGIRVNSSEEFKYEVLEPLHEGEILVYWLGQDAHLGETMIKATKINDHMCVPLIDPRGGCAMISKEMAMEFFNLVEKTDEAI